jgi:C4-dicarboxylate transporter DctQ subunit
MVAIRIEPMTSFFRLLDRLCDGLAILSAAALVAIMLGIVFQATARSIGYSGSSHIFTFSEFGLLFIVMAASPWLVREKGHVVIELFTAAMSARFRRPYSRGVAFLCMLICLLLVWFTFGATIKAYRLGDVEMRSLDLPRWILFVSMPIGFLLMAAQFIRFVIGPASLHSGAAGIHE